MAHEFARNIKDYNFSSTFALPATSQTDVTSATLDFGSNTVTPEEVELELYVPTLSVDYIDNAETMTIAINTATLAAFGNNTATLWSEQFTGATGATISAFTRRVRLPSNMGRYVRAKISFGNGTADASALNAVLSARF